MGVGAGLYMYHVVVKNVVFAISYLISSCFNCRVENGLRKVKYSHIHRKSCNIRNVCIIDIQTLCITVPEI